MIHVKISGLWKGVFFADFFSKPLRLVEPRLQNFTTEVTLFLLSIPGLLLFGLYLSIFLNFLKNFKADTYVNSLINLKFAALPDLFVVVFVSKRLRENGIKYCVDSQTTFSLLFTLAIYCHTKTDYFRNIRSFFPIGQLKL